MKIAVFENEWHLMKVSFENANLMHFQNSLVFEPYQTSQDFGDINAIIKYDYAIIDIDLTPKSHYDGYQLIKQILDLKQAKPKIIILTGHENIGQQLALKGLPSFPIISKPVFAEDILKAIK